MNRPTSKNPLFVMYEPEIVSKSRTPIQRQRDLDGTPHTTGGRYRLSPPDVELTLNPALIKSSMVEKIEEKKETKNPIDVVKSFLNGDMDKACAPEEDSKVPAMLKSIAGFAALCGYAKDDD